jgi:hypothetical protein
MNEKAELFFSIEVNEVGRSVLSIRTADGRTVSRIREFNVFGELGEMPVVSVHLLIDGKYNKFGVPE